LGRAAERHRPGKTVKKRGNYEFTVIGGLHQAMPAPAGQVARRRIYF
jgi:hypothetical protein